ncbi:family 32 putative glycosyltransferase [Triangularia verruculosa]|uniref:Family 32 putative glycosyltransferase n=1 Tax=Triangularia verruculosa TaxID=2587418 RepID=A0AAN6XP05_9PEZI|nr:family 32 putative glycosyltransferase [Triangularia verruculosa]
MGLLPLHHTPSHHHLHSPNSKSRSRASSPSTRRRSGIILKRIAYSLITIAVVGLWCARDLVYDTYTLAALPLFKWRQHASSFYLSAVNDGFDVTFESYPVNQTSAVTGSAGEEGYEDRVPGILHHIALGPQENQKEGWEEARERCVRLHPGWEAMLWTDEAADELVREHYPEMLGLWEGDEAYQYGIQRVDALRYMVLYRYGGVILDMDLQCKRALGPLRRFEFVAPAANPTGFSIGFMMAEKRNKFVGELVDNLKRYNRHWLGLPYPTVMFSTGCHYASTIHAFFKGDRSKLKILGGIKGNKKLHMLSGPVNTPLFKHLGSSSWHSYDAAMIVNLGKSVGGSRWRLPILFLFAGGLFFLIIRRIRRRVGSLKV